MALQLRSLLVVFRGGVLQRRKGRVHIEIGDGIPLSEVGRETPWGMHAEIGEIGA